MTVQRVSSAEDVKTVAALAAKIWTEHYTPLIGAAQVAYMLEKFQSEQAIGHSIQQGKLHYFLAVDNHRYPCGYGAVSPEADDSLFLSKLYVLSSRRGQGVGRSLLNHALQTYPMAKTVYLTVNKGNQGAIAAYEKMGFVIVSEEVTDIGGGYKMDDYRLCLTVKTDKTTTKGELQMSEANLMSETNMDEAVHEHERNPEESKRKKWADFVESVVVDFFSDNKLEKLSLEDGNGNKAKLGKTKDNEIKLEYSTTKLL